MAELKELELYHRLHDGLSDMIESGRLTKADIPDDYHWLVETLATLGAETSAEAEKSAITMAQPLWATFVPEAEVQGHIIEIDGQQQFDATRLVLGKPISQIREMRDNSYVSDQLAIEAGMLENHTGPFRVEIEEALCKYLSIEEIGEITPTILVDARQRLEPGNPVAIV